MLYITTKTDKDAFTAYKALHNNTASDGGMYVPFRFPVYSTEDIYGLKEKSFNQIVADILNSFFSCRLTGWDVDFCIGRNSYRIADAGNKVVVAELWHNLASNYSFTVKKLYEQITQTTDTPTDWFCIAVEIAILFGIYVELLKSKELNTAQNIDISVQTGDFHPAISAWYARKMGLPIGTIICSSNGDGIIWDFLHRGTFSTASAATELKNTVSRLIQGSFGYSAVEDFIAKSEKSHAYVVDEELLTVLNDGFFCSVIGEDRSASVMNSVYRNSSYIMDPESALCYGGLQDYRAKTGNNHLTMLLSRESALHHSKKVTEATGLTGDQLSKLVNHF